MAAGIGLAAVGFAGRYLLKRMPHLSQKMVESMKKLDSQVGISIFFFNRLHSCICMHKSVDAV